MARERFSWFGECSKGHTDRVFGYDPEKCPGEKYCDFNVRDELGRTTHRCNSYQTWKLEGSRHD